MIVMQVKSFIILTIIVQYILRHEIMINTISMDLDAYARVTL